MKKWKKEERNDGREIKGRIKKRREEKNKDQKAMKIKYYE